MKEVKIINTSVLSDQRFPLKRIRFEHNDGRGELISRDHEVYHTANGAAVLLYNKEKGTVLLVRQFRLPVFLDDGEGMTLEACAGLVNQGELPEVAAKREALEETGYRVDTLKLVCNSYSTPGCVTERLHLFIAEYDSSMRVSDGGGLQEEHEEIELVEVLYSDALKYVSTGQVIDNKTIILLYHLKVAGIM